MHDLRATQQALRESEEHLRLATEAGGIGTFSFGLQERHSFCSDTTRKLLGLPPDVIFQGKLLLSCVHPDDRPDITRHTRRALETGEPCRCQFRVSRGSQDVRWIELMAHVRKDQAGRPAVLYGALLDVTERKRLEEERDALLDSERAARCDAARESRLKDEFIAFVSHELRSPLTAILGWADLLRRGAVAPERTEKALDVIERNAALLGRLIGDMLDIERIRVGKLKLDMSTVDLARTVDVALDTLRPAANERRVRVERKGDLASAKVNGDPARLQQIVGNLLHNAIKFSAAGGCVEVCLSQTKARVILAVRDQGLGIRPETLPHVFERFRQAESSSRGRQGGLGLGLAIVKNLVDLHGGAVRAESEGIGRGATLTVELPVADEAGSTEDTPVPAVPERPRLFEGCHILVVDDELDAREILARFLDEEGALARTASTASEAIHVIQSGWPSVVLSDISMPGEDGFHLVRTIRSDPRTASLPILAVTAFIREADRARALRAGFTGHVPKPVEPHRLFDELARVLDAASRAYHR